MFKDYNKYLSTSLKVYLFVLVFIFILKLVGLDYFGLDIDNPFMIKLNSFCINYKIDIIYSYIVCYITSYIMVSITVNDNSKKLKIYMLLILPLTILVKYLGNYLNNTIFVIVQIMYLYIFIKIYSKQKCFKKYIIINFIFLILQIISTIVRNQSFNYNEYNFIIAFLINLDYIILCIITYKLYFLKGVDKKCYQVVEVGYYSQMKANLKNLPKRLQKNLHNFKQLDKKSKIAFYIYFAFSLIWNILTILIVLLVARLNHTFIECIFILSSFWLSKHSFGRPFHLQSMFQCFIVSNLTYYVLNRITTPLGVSIIVPIMLGVGLSYITSNFTKKLYKPLYRGMPKELFEETILKVEDKDSIKYKICYEYYIEKKIAINLSMKYHYSEAGIRKILKIVNKKIKELNK